MLISLIQQADRDQLDFVYYIVTSQLRYLYMYVYCACVCLEIFMMVHLHVLKHNNYIMIGYNSSKEKQKLQNVMAFGSDIEPTSVNPTHRVEEGRQKEVDRFDEILQEITERKEFLDEMESLGQGKQYRSKIMTEISQVSNYYNSCYR